MSKYLLENNELGEQVENKLQANEAKTGWELVPSLGSSIVFSGPRGWKG